LIEHGAFYIISLFMPRSSVQEMQALYFLVLLSALLCLSSAFKPTCNFASLHQKQCSLHRMQFSTTFPIAEALDSETLKALGDVSNAADSVSEAMDTSNVVFGKNMIF
jgi:hypothetical protein